MTNRTVLNIECWIHVQLCVIPLSQILKVGNTKTCCSSPLLIGFNWQVLCRVATKVTDLPVDTSPHHHQASSKTHWTHWSHYISNSPVIPAQRKSPTVSSAWRWPCSTAQFRDETVCSSLASLTRVSQSYRCELCAIKSAYIFHEWINGPSVALALGPVSSLMNNESGGLVREPDHKSYLEAHGNANAGGGSAGNGSFRSKNMLMSGARSLLNTHFAALNLWPPTRESAS